MNPCSPRFVYLFVALRILASRPCSFATAKIVIIYEIANFWDLVGASERKIFGKMRIIH